MRQGVEEGGWEPRPGHMMDLDYREKWTDASHLIALGNGSGRLGQQKVLGRLGALATPCGVG